MDKFMIRIVQDAKKIPHLHDGFVLDGNGDGTAHIEWDKKEEGYAGTVIGISVSLEFEKDSEATSMYVESMSLAWEC